jgi:hypothetical protein
MNKHTPGISVVIPVSNRVKTIKAITASYFHFIKLK